MALALLLAFGAAAGQGMTFAEALALAAHAPTVALAERALDLALRQYDVTTAPVRGELSAGYRWTWGERDLGEGGIVDLGGSSSDPVTLTLSFPALGPGPAADAIARAAADVERAEVDLAAARRGARVDVVQAFQRALRTRESVTLAEAELALAALEGDAVGLRGEAGAATSADLERAALAIERARTALAAAERETVSADRLLRTLLGADIGVPSGPLPDPRPWLVGVDVALTNRPSVAAATLQLAETDRLAAGALRDNLPSLSLGATAAIGDADRSLQFGAGFDTRAFQPTLNLAFDPDTGLTGLSGDVSSRSFGVSVAVRVPLNPAVGASLEGARIGRERALLQLEVARARAELEADQRRAELDSALANAALAQASAELAHADVEVLALRAGAGSVAPLIVIRARVDAQRADLEAARALDAARVAALLWLDAVAFDAVPTADAPPIQE